MIMMIMMIMIRIDYIDYNVDDYDDDDVDDELEMMMMSCCHFPYLFPAPLPASTSALSLSCFSPKLYIYTQQSLI